MTVGEATSTGVRSSSRGDWPRSARPARPPWRDFFRIRREFDAGVLEGLTFIHRTYGPFVQTRLPLELYFVADPACVEGILLRETEAFRKDRTSRLLSRVVGNGLLVNEGDFWRRQRRVVQPAFPHGHWQSYASVMTGAIEQAPATWKPGQVRNGNEDMMAVTLNI